VKRKGGFHWERDENGALRMVEVEIDEGPSAASGVSRGVPGRAARGRRHRGAQGQRKQVLRGAEPRVYAPPRIASQNVHPGDRESTRPGWERAVDHRAADNAKRRKAGVPPEREPRGRRVA
jgi:hypothetical protein